MAYTRRKYAGGAAATTTTGSVGSSATSFTINSYTGWPYGTDPFYVVMSPGTAAEEKMLVTRATSTDTTVNVTTRGVDGTVAATHASGATTYPVFTATDADEANAVAAVISGGTTNQALVADTAQATGFKWSSSLTGLIVDQLEENWNVAATAATGTINFNVKTASAWLYTSNASANWTLNVRGDASTTLSSLLEVGDSITVVFAVTNGTTAYYQTALQIDGSSVTPKWQGGTAPSSGNASSVDLYSLTIVKTAATPTYTVFESRSKFA